jgi:hypothetical protein
LEVVPYIARYNSVPAFPAYSYLVLRYILKILALNTSF